MKQVDTAAYIGTLLDLVAAGNEVSVRISGNSMSPFLVNGRDEIVFEKPADRLKKGDMVFYQRPNGQYVMHRICKIRGNDLYFIGDAQTKAEGPLPASRVLALVTKVKRKGKWLTKGDFCWEFFAKVWIRMIPLRRVICKCYFGLKGIFKHG